MAARTAALAAAVLLAGCGGSGSGGGSGPPVWLTVDSQVTGGKALVFAATTGEDARLGGRYALELRGVDPLGLRFRQARRRRREPLPGAAMRVDEQEVSWTLES